MGENSKTEHEKLRELVSLHHVTLKKLICLLKKKEEKEAEFWASLIKYLKEVE